MRRKMVWLAAIAGLLVVGLVGQAVAAEVTQRAAGVRFSCGQVPGDPITVTGTVSEQAWNTLVVDASGTVYTVKTGPYKTGLNLPDLTGRAVTVEGFTAAGQNCQNQTTGVNLVQARTITAGEEVYDLTQVPAGGGWGRCMQARQGSGNQFRCGQGGGSGQQGGRGNGGNGRNGSGACGNCPRTP